jgi:DNA-binding beta-propeller fold protein YncE
MKKIECPLKGGRTGPRSHPLARFGRSVAKFLLMAGLIVLPAAEPTLTGALPPPGFESQVIDQWGGLKKPSRIAISPDGRIFVSDTLRGVVAILDPVGRRVGTLTGLNEPLGVAASARTRRRCTGGCGLYCRNVTTKMAYAGDQRDGSVWVYENGEPTRTLGAGAGEFLKPNGIAVTRSQVVYVVDSEAGHIKVFAPNGTLDKTFGSASWGWYPTDIALNETSGELYVADHLNRSILVFDLDGVWLRYLSAPNNDQGDPAFYRIAGIGIGPSGNLYVVDSALSSVTVLTPDGALIDIIGYQFGSYWTGELNVPIDAATDGNQVYVTSSNDHMVKVFEVAQ